MDERRVMPTRTNGGIPPTVRRLKVIAVDYCIGSGSESEPFRLVTALYNDNGDWLGTLSDPLPDPQPDGQEGLP